MLTASTVNHYPTLLLTDEQLQRIHDAELEAYEAEMNAEPVPFRYYVATEYNDSLVIEFESNSVFDCLCNFYSLVNDSTNYDEVEFGEFDSFDEMSPLKSSLIG